VALWALFAHDSRTRDTRVQVVYMELVAVRTPAARPAPPSLPQPQRKTDQRDKLAAAEKSVAPVSAPQSIVTTAIVPAAVDGASTEPATAPALNATTADNALSVAPRPIDVDALRKLAREDERHRVQTPLDRVRDSQRVRAAGDTDTARAVAQSARSDCRHMSGESTNFNPLLLIPLIYQTLADTGCKW
jgi:hypothetical protein